MILFQKYTFNTHRIEHYFCPTCGIGLAVRSIDPDFFAGYYGLNARAFDGVDVDKLEKKNLDGRSHD
jgi:hypothetical protein